MSKSETNAKKDAEESTDNIDIARLTEGVFQDEYGNRWKFFRRYTRVPSPLGSEYQTRVLADCGDESKQLRLQKFAERVKDGTYTITARSLEEVDE